MRDARRNRSNDPPITIRSAATTSLTVLVVLGLVAACLNIGQITGNVIVVDIAMAICWLALTVRLAVAVREARRSSRPMMRQWIKGRSLGPRNSSNDPRAQHFLTADSIPASTFRHRVRRALRVHRQR
jgi:hypothetical protein